MTARKEIPILYSAQVVSMKIAGRKDITRRPMKKADEELFHSEGWAPDRWPVGAVLWGRENFQLYQGCIQYAVDGECSKPLSEIASIEEANTWISRAWRDGIGVTYPSIHMPKFACRILDEIVSVRIEPLHAITDEDAIREGIGSMVVDGLGRLFQDYGEDGGTLHPFRPITPIESYRTLWESIYGPGSWDSNPWVWRIETRPIAPAQTSSFA